MTMEEEDDQVGRMVIMEGRMLICGYRSSDNSHTTWFSVLIMLCGCWLFCTFLI